MNTESVNTHEEQVESEEYVQEMIEKGEQLEQANDPSRPEWLPDKFKSPEDMANAYSNLEKKLGQGEEEEQEQEQEEYEEESEEESETDPNDVSNVKQVVENADLDFDVLQNEYNELGGLSADAYEALNEAGFPQEIVDSWIQGQEALANNYQQAVYSNVGGEENYSNMVLWASENLSPQEIAAYDRAVESGDIDMVNLAVSGLQTKYQSAEGATPSLVQGNATTSTGGTYGSWAEVTTAMRDSRYESDPAYRQAVTNKLARSSNIQ